MVKVIDDRNDCKNLCNIEIGECFIWKEELYQRIVFPSVMDKAFVEATAPDEIPCIHIEVGLLVGIDRSAIVEPVDVEAHIVGE